MVIDNEVIVNSLILSKRFVRSIDDLTIEGLTVLLCLYEYPRMTAKDISEAMGISEQVFVKIKRVLIKNDYVSRCYTLALSDKGKELCKEFRLYVLSY